MCQCLRKNSPSNKLVFASVCLSALCAYYRRH
jgi:hypothetical protein